MKTKKETAARNGDETVNNGSPTATQGKAKGKLVRLMHYEIGLRLEREE